MYELVESYQTPASTTLATFVRSVLSHSLNTLFLVRLVHLNAFSTSKTDTALSAVWSLICTTRPI